MPTCAKLVLCLRLTFALLFAVMNGMDMSFNVYAVTLKETFNFTQTQVEVVASMGMAGVGLAFLETCITRLFGYITTFVLTGVCLPASCVLFALAASHSDFFHRWPIFVYLTQLLLTSSNNIAYMVITRCCLDVIPHRLTGTFIGLLGTAVCLGKIVFAALMDLFFLDDLAGFFLCLSVMFAVVLGVCYVLQYPVAIQLEQKLDSRSGDKAESTMEDKSFGEILRSPFFQMTFWSAAVFSAIAYSILNNITSVTDSLGMRDTFTTVTLMSVCIMATRLIYGIIFDKVSSHYCGFFLMFTGYFSTAAGLSVGIFSLDTTTVHWLTALSGFGVGTALYLPLAALVVQFGRSSYSSILASIYAAIAALMVMLQLIMGFLYDAKITNLGVQDRFCYSADCFFSSFALLLTLTISVIIIQVINCITTA